MSADRSSPAPTDRRPRVVSLPGFAAFLGARLAAVFSMQIQAVVVAWQVYDLTRDPLALAYAGLAQFLPMVVLLLPAGDLIDRFNRKRILILNWALQVLCSALLWWLSIQQAPPLLGFYAVLVLFGCSRAFAGPTLQSLLPQIVPRDQLARAIAVNASIMKVAVIGGPVLGGLLYAFGGAAAYAVCFGCTLGAIALLARVPVRHASGAKAQEASAWGRFAAGLRYMRSRPIILGAISLDLFAVLLGGVVALLPIYAQEVLEVGPAGLGALRSASAIGALGMGLYLGARSLDHRVGRVMFAAVALFGLCNLVFALSTLFWLSWLALLIAGAADMISVYVRTTLIQLATPDEMRGRVNAVNMLFIGSSNELGEFRAGMSAAWLGGVSAALLGGVTTLAVVGLWMWRFPALREVDRFEQVTTNDRNAIK
ncbi:MFS transporter [Halotalea alkalilenta]|uniref:MFS transporter n=1 Tax=Halotalea alkalilenta TaxID=376489 RepID=UPI000486AB17|nr:MFS transporter [Halotalea alkalilenta]